MTGTLHNRFAPPFQPRRRCGFATTSRESAATRADAAPRGPWAVRSAARRLRYHRAGGNRHHGFIRIRPEGCAADDRSAAGRAREGTDQRIADRGRHPERARCGCERRDRSRSLRGRPGR
jgi:hypothetical protein